MIRSHDDATIIAQCTPRGSGAIALLRIAGVDALSITNAMSTLGKHKKITDVPTHTIHYGWVTDQNKKHIDQVMFLVMHGPKTFTGQDTIEITCHNNQFIIEKIIERAITCGARLADNGEFTKRAVLNKKIDLIQAEAINELIHAQTQHALKKSLSQLEGSLSEWTYKIANNLVKALALSEASFEFIDEEISFAQPIKKIIDQNLNTIVTIKKTFNQQQQIRQGIRIALVGSVNTGKSSLFNAIIGTQRAIVTNIAGTTRDSIEAGLYRNGNYWTLIDTAGLRQTNDVIEQQGIKRSFEQAQRADIVLLVFDGSQKLSDIEQPIYKKLLRNFKNKIITVQNKSDLSIVGDMHRPTMDILVSSKKNKNIEHIDQLIQQKIDSLFKHIESPFLLNQRHYNLILKLEKSLQQIMTMLSANVQYELLSYHLNDAIAQLSELSGKTISEQGMDMVFREFCVGK